jgi:NhaA family Na+:H+ antiporter
MAAMSRADAESLPARVLQGLVSPAQRFIGIQSSSGIVLIVAAAVALAWANSPWADAYEAMRATRLALHIGGFTLQHDLLHWVNDLLMALFFFRVGLEIKRELVAGELSSRDRAILPAAAALGGMVVPASIFLAITYSGEGMRGWGVPMATDIAFAIGVLALLGSRVPLPLKVFLLALAIVDDLGAIAVIAFFYIADLDAAALGISLGAWALAVFYGAARGTSPIVYAAIGAGVWYFMLQSGVHATIAGVLMALAIPLRHGVAPDEMHERAGEAADAGGYEDVQATMERLDVLLRRSDSPLHRMERALAVPVAYLVMPAFALFNAGVALGGQDGAQLSVSAVSLGVFAGLVVGKPLGILGFAWIAVRIGHARLPAGIGWPAMLGVGLLGGIGFTMSLFIGNLAFAGADALLGQAKLAIFAASTAAALAGLTLLALVLRKPNPGG